MRENVFARKVLPLFTVSLIVTFVSSFLGLPFVEYLSNIVIFLGLIVLCVICIIALYLKPNLPLLLVFNVLEGLTLTTLIYAAGIIDASIIPEAFGLTALIFIIFSLISWKSEYNFLSWGKALFILVIIALIVSLVQFFIHSPLINIAIDIGVILLFIGFVLYDTQNILEKYSDEQYIDGCIDLYLDFLNIFVRIVDVLIRSRD